MHVRCFHTFVWLCTVEGCSQMPLCRFSGKVCVHDLVHQIVSCSVLSVSLLSGWFAVYAMHKLFTDCDINFGFTLWSVSFSLWLLFVLLVLWWRRLTSSCAEVLLWLSFVLSTAPCPVPFCPTCRGFIIQCRALTRFVASATVPACLPSLYCVYFFRVG